MVEDLGEQLDDQCLDDDESITASAHKDLLGAVTQLYEKKRVKAPTRNEPSIEVSEFHLSQPDKKRGGRVTVTDLAKVLKKRTTHLEIGQKLQTARRRAKTLPKPLEKFHADKINRAAGYEQAKQQLSRWDAIVHQQRVAETVSFPLPKSDNFQVHESTDIKKMFRKPTELELKLAEVLNQPDPLDQIREAKTHEEDDFPLSLEEIIERRKILAKIRARQSYKDAKAAWKNKIKSKTFRKIERKVKAKEQLKEFEEMQKKDPEGALKKLEELERARAEERMTQRHGSTGRWAKGKAIRARYDKEARIVLAEQLSKKRELTTKLAQNRDESEEEEAAEPEPVTVEEMEGDLNNPWVLKRSKEMDEFVSGYRKYWETQGKLEENAERRDTAVKVKQNNATEAECLDKENDQRHSVGSGPADAPNSDANPEDVSDQVENKPKSNVENSILTNLVIKARVGKEPNSVKSNKGTVKPTVANTSSGTQQAANAEAAVVIPKPAPAKSTLGTPKRVKKPINTGKTTSEIHKSEKLCSPSNVSANNQSLVKDISVNKNLFVVNKSSMNNVKENIALDQKSHNFMITNTKVISTKNNIMLKSSSESSSKVINDAGSWSVNKIIKNMKKKERKVFAENTTNDELGNSYTVTVRTKSSNSIVGSSKTLSSSSFVVSKIDINSKDSNRYCKSTKNVQQEAEKIKTSMNKSVNKPRKRSHEVHINNKAENSTKSIDDMFNEAEDKLRKQIQRKVEKLSEKLNRKRKESESGSESNTDEMPSLEMKRSRTTADIDEPLVERTGDGREGKKTSVEQNLELASAPIEELRPSEDINPNKFLKVKPRHLSSELPEIISEGEDALDEEEKAAEERHLTISEAFADDNVVDEFQKEKEEEGKKSKVGDVDLTLPGWGSWAGHNISSSSKNARRKRKKFVIKIPLAPRRDKNRDNIIINEDADKPLKEHQVSTVPFPFTSVKEFEASVRAPLGSTWLPQRAFRRVTLPAVVTQAGAIIEPMDVDQLVNPASGQSRNIKRNFL